jgi:molybdenum cofactor biosynthesis enzyme MoaA
MPTPSSVVPAPDPVDHLPELPPLWVQPDSVTILGTYKCTAACENCCFDSNPFLTQRLDLADILAFIDEAARLPQCSLVVFSGGECFLLRDDLVTAVRHATNLGLRTRCVTNGFWAKRLPHGRRRLQALVEAGLCEINVSTGDFHQRWVDSETVVNAVSLAVELGLEKTVLMIELQKERRVTAAQLGADPRVRGLLDTAEDRFKILESPWMPMRYDEVIDQPAEAFLDHRNLHLRTGCRSILRTIVITPTKDVGFCCGLTREHIPELNVAWDGTHLDGVLEPAGRDFMKIWLHVEGPERILAWAAGKDSRIEWEGRYAHHCHACLALFDDPVVRDVIRTHYRERVDDVLIRYVADLRQRQGMHSET